MEFNAQDVATGRRLVTSEGNVRLELGDLIAHVAPIGNIGENTGTTAIVAAFAEEIGIDKSVAQAYREVSEAIVKSTRELIDKRGVFVSWTVLRYATFGDGRLDKLIELIRARKPGDRITLAELTEATNPETTESTEPTTGTTATTATTGSSDSAPQDALETVSRSKTIIQRSRDIVQAADQIIEDLDEIESDKLSETSNYLCNARDHIDKAIAEIDARILAEREEDVAEATDS